MANDFYTYSDGTFSKGSKARAEAVAAEYQKLETGLDKLPSQDQGNQETRNYAANTGAANAYACAFAHVSASYQVGQKIVLQVDVADKNTSTSCTLNVSTIGNTSIKYPDGSDPIINDIQGMCEFRYTGTVWHFISTSVASVAASAASAAAAAASESASATSESNASTSETNAAASAAAALASELLIGKTCVVRTAGLQTLTTAVAAAINFDAEIIDDDTMHDNVTNNTRITVPTGATRGKIHAVINFTANSTGIRMLQLYTNGGKQSAHPQVIIPASSSGALTQGVLLESHIFGVTPGDYFEIKAYQDSGGNLDVRSDSVFSFEITG